MIHGITNDVDKGVLQPLDHGLVQFGLAAFGDQLDLLAKVARKVPNYSLKTTEGGGDGEHADAHGRVAQLSGQTLDFFSHEDDFRIAGGPGDLRQSRLDRHQLAHNVGQPVEFSRGNPDGRGRVGGLMPLTGLANLRWLEKRRVDVLGVEQIFVDQHFAGAETGFKGRLHLFRRNVAQVHVDLVRM